MVLLFEDGVAAGLSWIPKEPVSRMRQATPCLPA